MSKTILVLQKTDRFIVSKTDLNKLKKTIDSGIEKGFILLPPNINYIGAFEYSEEDAKELGNRLSICHNTCMKEED